MPKVPPQVGGFIKFQTEPLTGVQRTVEMGITLLVTLLDDRIGPIEGAHERRFFIHVRSFNWSVSLPICVMMEHGVWWRRLHPTLLTLDDSPSRNCSTFFVKKRRNKR